jgi:hypothetical protein
MKWIRKILGLQWRDEAISKLRRILFPSHTLPEIQRWNEINQQQLAAFMASETGRKLIEHCRHKIFSEHVEACQSPSGAEYHNATIKGMNNLLASQLYLAMPDSISRSAGDQAEKQTAPDQHESGGEFRRAY